jgi:hypothetical protein
VQLQNLTAQEQLIHDWLSVESWELDRYLGPMKEYGQK